MSEKYYVWSELADCIQDSNELKIALLSKALLVERNEDFLGSIHLTLADLLIKEELTSEALCELNIYKKFHENTSRKYQEYIERVDISVIPPNNNKLLYNRYATIAEEYAFQKLKQKRLRWWIDGKKTENLLHSHKWGRRYISSECKAVSFFDECDIWFCF